jgi:GAF domain-containing protein/HAMP domain-containing protein
MTFWKNNLLRRLVFSFFLISATSTAVIGLFGYYLAEETLTSLIYDQLNSVAAIKEEELQKWVIDQQDDLNYISNLSHLHDASQALLQLDKAGVALNDPAYQAAYNRTNAYLADVRAHKPAFSEILIMAELGGKVVASTRPNSIGQYRIHDSYFREGRSGPYTQKPYISPYDSRPAMSVSKPIHDDDGRLLGVIAIHLSLVDIDDIIRLPTGLAETGEVYLVDRHNAFFSSERLGREEFLRGVHSTGIDRAVNGENGQAIYNNYDGVPVIGVYQWLDQFDLALMAEISVNEAFAPARRLAFFILGLGALVTLVLVLAVYLVARRVTQPILAIADTAVAVADGNLSVTAPVTSSDEVGLLARTFNQMVSQLNTLYAGLEQKVRQLQEKEKALQQYARRLEAQHEIDRAILKAQLPADIGLAALTHVHELIECHRSSIFLFEKDEAVLLASISHNEVERHKDIRFPTSEVSSYTNLQQGNSYTIPDLKLVPNPKAGQQYLLSLHIRTFVSLPLMARQVLIGSLNLGHRRPNAFSDVDIAIAREVADQLAIAIQQAQLLAATQRQLEELSVLHAIGTASTEAASEDNLIQRATETISAILPADNFGVMLLGENGRYLQAHRTYQGSPDRLSTRFPINSCIVGQVALDGQPRRLGTIQHNPHHYSMDPNVHSQLCIPLKANSQMIGVFNAESYQPDAFSPADERLLVTFASQLATAIQKLRLFAQSENEIRERRRAETALREAHDQLEQRVTERTSELTLLNRATQTLISSLELNDVLASILDELRRLLQASASAVWLLDEEKADTLICQHSSGRDNKAIRGTRLPLSVGIVGWVATTGQSDLTHDALLDDRHYTFPDDQAINMATRSLLSVPLRIKDQTIGVIQVLDGEPNRFTKSDVALVESLAATAAFAIENARLYNQAREDAETKSVLLREVNHRVKNNLSAIIGVLYAERRHADLKDQAVYQAIMQDLINRVQGLATVHSLLSRAHWGPVSLSKLTLQVINSSLRALPSTKRIHVSVAPSEITVLPDQANSLALIINELATNSIKYALADRNAGRINVTISETDAQATLVFRDDGPGFPPDVLQTMQPRHNVGFHLVQNLVRRSLKGNLSLQNQQNGRTGAIVTIDFQITTGATADNSDGRI